MFMERIAVFPGSFDPFTIGHESIVRRALPLFEKIIIAVGQNITKGSFLPLENRMEWIWEVFAGEPKVYVQAFKGLTVDFCKKVNSKYIIRGLRTAADFEYERAAGQVNKVLDKNIESVYLLTNPEYSFINSTIVRDIIRHGGDANIFLPHSNKMREFLKTMKL
jgi:pantetheine-phosphate adenylyltransferase